MHSNRASQKLSSLCFSSLLPLPSKAREGEGEGKQRELAAMVVSFKVSRTGSRYRSHPRPRPRPCLPSPEPHAGGGEAGGEARDPERDDREVNLMGLDHVVAGCSVSSANFDRNIAGQEHEASFSLNLFPDGFSIGKPTEGMLLPLLEDVPKMLHPYTKTSMTLFSAIEYGWLPVDILDDIPCKYFSGTLICEIWDYRTCLSKFGNNESFGDEFPKVQKVRLRMGTENVIKDMPSISDDSWTYGDLLQAESQIIKALQPVLYLGSNPSLDRLCGLPISKQIDLGIHQGGLTRKQPDAVKVNSISTDLSNEYNSKSNVFVDNLTSQVPPPSGGGPACSASYAIPIHMPLVQKSSTGKGVSGQAFPLIFQTSPNLAVTCSFSAANTVPATSDIISAPNQRLESSGLGQKNCATLPHGKRNRSISQSNPKTIAKRLKQGLVGSDSTWNLVSQRNALLEKEIQRKITQLGRKQDTWNAQNPKHVDQVNINIKTNETNFQKTPLLEVQTVSSLCQRDGVKHCIKEEPPETKDMPGLESGKNKEGRALDLGSKTSSQQEPLPLTGSQPLHMQISNSDPSFSQKSLRRDNAPRKRKLPQGPEDSTGASVCLPAPMLGAIQRKYFKTACTTCPSLSTTGVHKDNAASVPVTSNETASVKFSSVNSLMHLEKKCKALSMFPSPNISNMQSLATFSNTNVPLSLAGVSAGKASMQSPPSGTNGDDVILERLSKIQMVVRRHEIGDKKIKVDKFVHRKSSSHYSLPPSHLFMIEDNEKFTPLTEEICMSKCLLGGSRNGCKTRILTFMHAKFYFRGSGMPLLVNESHIKLVLLESEEPGDHKVVAEVIYSDGEHRIHLSVLPSLHQADLFASQFISLMEHDGYTLMDDQCHPISAGGRESSLHIASLQSIELPCMTTYSCQSLKTSTPIDQSMSTPEPPCFLTQNIVSPTTLPPTCFSLTRLQQLEFTSRLSMQRSVRTSQNNSLGNQMSNGPNYLQFLEMQQRQRKQYYQHSILPGRLANTGATSNIMGMGGHFSSLGVAQMNYYTRKVLGFCHLSQEFHNRGLCQAQETLLTNMRQAYNLGMGLMDGVLSKSSSGDITGMNQGLFRGKVSISPLSVPPLNMGMLNSDQLQQPEIQQGLLEFSLQQQHQQLLASPQQHGSTPGTEMGLLMPSWPLQTSSGSVPQQVNSSMCNIGSPQLSSQTVISSGSVTRSTMELQGISKASNSRNAAFAER